MNKELLIPPKAAASSCRERIRVWAGDGDVHVPLATEIWDDPGSWGVLLVDLARHVADTYEERGRGSREEYGAIAMLRHRLGAPLPRDVATEIEEYAKHFGERIVDAGQETWRTSVMDCAPTPVAVKMPVFPSGPPSPP